MQREIEAQSVPHRFHLLLGNGGIPKEHLGGIPGHQMQHQEHDDQDAKHDED